MSSAAKKKAGLGGMRALRDASIVAGFHELLKLPCMAKRSLYPLATAVGHTQGWFLSRRPAAAAAGAVAASSASTLAVNQKAVWWGVRPGDLEREFVQIAGVATRELYGRLRSASAMVGASTLSVHPVLGVPAIWEAWSNGTEDYELVFANPLGEDWGVNQWVLGKRPAITGSEPSQALRNDASAAGSSELAPDPSDASPEPRAFDWIAFMSTILVHRAVAIGSLSGRMAHSSYGKRLRDAVRSGVVAKRFSTLPGSPLAHVHQWVDAGTEFFLAIVNPADDGSSRRCSCAPVATGAAAVPTLLAWLGIPMQVVAAPKPVRPADGWGPYQLVLGKRVSPGGAAVAAADADPLDAHVPPPYDWLSVHADALKQHGIRIGSLAATTVYDKYRGRIREAERRGASESAPACPLLPGTPPALVEYWTDGGIDFFLALVHPAESVKGIKVGTRKRKASAAGLAGAAAAPPPSEHRREDAAALRAWLGLVPLAEADAAKEAGMAAAGGIGTHQWVLGRRDLAAVPDAGGGAAPSAGPPPPPYKWVAVSSHVLASHGIPLGSVGTRTVYFTRGTRIRDAWTGGASPPTACPLLPGSPLALWEEWTDSSMGFFLALVNPVEHPTQVPRSMGSRVSLEAKIAQLREWLGLPPVAPAVKRPEKLQLPAPPAVK
jgi:hypothetical protein